MREASLVSPRHPLKNSISISLGQHARPRVTYVCKRHAHFSLPLHTKCTHVALVSRVRGVNRVVSPPPPPPPPIERVSSKTLDTSRADSDRRLTTSRGLHSGLRGLFLLSRLRVSSGAVSVAPITDALSS